MLNKKLKKVIAGVTMFASVVCLSGVSMLAPLSVKAATTLVDGDIVKTNATNSDGTPAISSLDVYIVKTVGTKMFKRLVLNPDIFQSYGHLKWENLKTVSQAEIDVYTTSSLVRVDGSDKVYAITPVTGGDTGAKSWINVTAPQFLSLPQSDPDSIYTINNVDGAAYSVKTDITTVAQLTAFYADGSLPAEAATGALNVSLSATTPVSRSIPVKASAEFTAIKLAAGSAAVSINSITVTASGYGDATNIDDVALYINGSKVGSSKDINSEKEATFNFSTPIAISANASKTLTIRATAVPDTGTGAGSYVLGIKEAADVITAGGSVAGSFPIYGNTMAADTNVTTGTVLLDSVDGTDASRSFGEDNVLLASFSLTANNEGAIIDSLRFKNGGTNQAGIISNLKLVIDGEDVADGDYDSSTGYVTFAVDGEYKIDKSDTPLVEVYGDLGVASATDTVTLYLKNKDDFAFVGEDYGFGVLLTDAGFAALDTVAKGITVTLTTGDITIDMDKAATPAKDVKADTDNVVLATFTVTSNGENATLESISDSGIEDNSVDDKDFEIQGTNLILGSIENVEMRDTATGSIYDIAASRVDSTQWTLSITDEINLVKGVKKTFEIRADLNSTLIEGSTLRVVIDGDTMTINGDESDSSITDITPASVTSSVATVKVASLDWTTTALIAKTVVPSASDVVIYQASVEAGTTDDVKLSTVKLATVGAVLNDFTDSNISKIDLYLDGKLIKSLSNGITESTASTAGTVTFGSLISTDGANVIKAGTTATLEARATFASSLTPTLAFSLKADAGIIARTSDNSVIDETITVATGSRTVTATAQGSLKVELLTADGTKTRDSVLLAGTANASGKYLGELKFTTVSEAIKVTELRLTNTGTADSSDIAEVQLVDAAGVVKAAKTPAVDGSVVFTGLSLPFAADQSTSYFIAVKARGMNVNGDASSTAAQGATIIYGIAPVEGVVAQGVDSGLDVALASDGTVAVAQVNTLAPTAVDAFTYTVTIDADGTPSQYISDADATVAEVAAGLVAAINADAGADAVTATNVSNTVVITANVTGTAFTIAVSANLANVATHANVPGAAATVEADEYSNFVTKSKTSVISGAVLNSIVNAMTNTTMTPGVEQTIGKYTLVFENGSNRTAANEELKAILKGLVLHYAGTNITGITGAEIYIEGTSAKATVSADGGAAPADLTWTNLTSLDNSGKVDGPVTLVITGTPTSISATYSLQTSIADTDNLTFYGDGVTTGSVNANNYLTTSNVSGAILQNS